MSHKEIDKALSLLVQKGLAEVRVVNGKKDYALTKKGLKTVITLNRKETSDYID